MKPSMFASLLLLCLSLFATPADGSSPGRLEHLLDCHDRAAGGEALRAAGTVRYELEIEEPSFLVTAIYRALRPDTMRIDVYAGEKRVFSEGLFDGSGWQLLGGADEPVPTSEEGAAALRHGLERPGHLWTLADMQDRGHRVELVDRETPGNASHMVLDLTLSDGFRTRYWIDEATCLIVRSRDFRAFHPDQDPERVAVETIFEDFRTTDGVTRAHRSQSVNADSGEVLATTRIVEVELDPPLDPDAMYPARSPASGHSDEGPMVSEVERLARTVVEEGRAAGLSVAILDDDGKLLSSGYGLADLENETPATGDTLYRIASITKRYTAFAILRLVESGDLSLDTRLGELLPDLPTHLHEIRVDQLLDHTSGIPNMTRLGERYWSQITNEVSPSDLIEIFRDEPLDFEPGTGYAYSNSGYVLLGRVVEVVSGMSYFRFLKHRVLEPLGLAETYECRAIEGHPRLATPYTLRQDRVVDAPAAHMSQGFSTGGLCSTAEDVARFVRAVHDKALQSALRRRMVRPRSLPDGTELAYGFGVGVGTLGDHRVYFHGGAFFGADAQAAQFPDDDVTVVVLSNTSGADAMRLENEISRKLLTIGEPDSRELPDPEPYIGTFRRNGQKVVVEASGNGLAVRGLWGDEPVALSYLGDETFAAEGQLYRVRFELDAEPPRLILSHYDARISVFERPPEASSERRPVAAPSGLRPPRSPSTSPAHGSSEPGIGSEKIPGWTYRTGQKRHEPTGRLIPGILQRATMASSSPKSKAPLYLRPGRVEQLIEESPPGSKTMAVRSRGGDRGHRTPPADPDVPVSLVEI